MKLRTIVRIAIISSIVLLCTGFIMYSFFKLSDVEDDENFNLYSLIPIEASAVFETNDMVRLVQNIDHLDCSKDQLYLPVSHLFASFKSYLNTLLDDTPHGLSKQMNKMLFSFHEPDNAWNQVLYCSLGAGDYQLLENFVGKLNTDAYPLRSFEYRGETIRIYPMPDGNFISCYITSRFLVLSYQKRLVEQVIDARHTGRSLMQDPFFAASRDNKKKNSSATVYTRMYSLGMGKESDRMRVNTDLGNWTEFEMKMNGRSIYFSGISQVQDSSQTFMSMLRKQQPLKGFPENVLPASTFFFSRRSVSDLAAMLSFTAAQEYAKSTYADDVRKRDEALSDYLREHGGGSVTTCLFRREKTVDGPAAVMSIPLNDAVQGERSFQRLIESMPAETAASRWLPRIYYRVKSKVHKYYPLPGNTLFSQLTGITHSSLSGYVCFYNNHLLLAPDDASLSQYIRHLENAELVDETPAYKQGVSGLADTYHFMLVADLGDMVALPDVYTRLVPSLFFRNTEFFRHFTLSAQFVCSDGVVYPNIVLSYKSE